MSKVYSSGSLQISFGVDHIEGPDADANGLVSSVHISLEHGPILLSMTKKEWVRLCDLTVIDRDMEAREAYFAQAKAWREMQTAVEAASEKIRMEIQNR